MTMLRILRSLAITFLISMALAPPAAAECDTALILAVDISGSITAENFTLQMNGIAAAFTDAGVIKAALAGPGRCTEVALFMWQAENDHILVLPWTRLDSVASATSIAAIIASAERPPRMSSTAIGSAIEYAIARTPPCAACRRVIDVSGDGGNNSGVPPDGPRDLADAAGITINGLVVLGNEPDVDASYRAHVITPGGGLWTADGFGTFASSIRSKLEAEIS